MSQQTHRDRLVELRRELHQYPEPAWREFYTTSRIVDELETIGVDELYVGPEVLAEEERMSVPDDDELGRWYEQARQEGAREDILERLEGGRTGAIAVIERGEGPTVALRVDIDGLLREESIDDDHVPATEGFRSEHAGAMHACGHDAHATIGIGVLEAIKDSDFEGTLKVLFQPGEEMVAGGKPMAKSGHLDDVDYLLAVHIGLDHPTGEVVAGVDGFLAVSHFLAEFTGEPAHAGGKPNAGENAVQAMATAIQNLYAIPRHEDGATRINAGDVGGGSATNIIPEQAYIEGEVRGETTHLKDYMQERADRVLESAAAMHGCSVEQSKEGEAPSAESDEGLVEIVHDVSTDTRGVENPIRRDSLGGSEDATYLMQEVQQNGGLAAYVGVGTDHPGGHHTSTFDVDEDSLPIAVDLLSSSIREIASKRP
ncbi:aminobenzoyl-glutamate utilization protein A [Haladaptatus litoreus]|uniref:Aminobenzoyl-glutamate utilization protein A n=1 Tax=Haladaptatus litoreus TaxID=553468 RepID=A0A1N6VM44_9EURY|nr:amidohydrolase [Haladaptatus litoreus]SIQ78943.1 aminobenzoyl-glutamate utilization protein A [Haladaptatus litoreus]